MGWGSVEFRILGPLEVLDDGRLIELGGPRQRCLLARLAVTANRVVPVDTLLDDLWDRPGPSAKDALQASVSRARRALGDPGRLVTQAPGYRLRVEPGELDAERFETAVIRAGAAADQGDDGAAIALLHKAEALWRGRPLVDCIDYPFAQAEAARLEEIRLRAIEQRVEADLALGDHARAVVDLEALVAAHPFRERFWAQLMIALYRSERQAEALRTFQKLRRCLGDELGIEPSTELRRLEAAILAHEPTLDRRPRTSDVGGHRGARGPRPPMVPAATKTRSPGPAAVAQRLGSLPFVGRHTELTSLTSVVACWRRDQGRPSVAVVAGEAGSGKSRLLHEFAEWCREHEVMTLEGRADGYPYQVFKGAIRDLLRALGDPSADQLGELRRSLGALLPELGVAAREVGELALARSRLFDAVALALELPHGEGPVALLLDDLHTLDEASAALLRALLARVWTRAPMIVAAHRPVEEATEAVRSLFVDVISQDDTVVIELGRLDEADLVELVERVPPRVAAAEPKTVASRLREATGGLPLLVREVLRSLETHPGGPASGMALLSAPTPVVNAVISRSLSRLSKSALELLRAGAVVGRNLDVDLLVAVSGQDEDEVLRSLDEARVLGGIVRDVPQADALAFDHDLVREVLAAGVSDVHRRRLHARAASILSARGLSVRAAHHALDAVPSLNASRAAMLVADGADQALGLLAFESARELCQRALTALSGIDAHGRAALLTRLGRALTLCGHPQEAEDVWRQAAATARAAGDAELLAGVALGTEQHARMIYPSELRWSLLHEAFDALEPGWSKARLKVSSALIAEAATPVRRLLLSDLAEELLSEARATGDPAVIVPVLHARHILSRGVNLPGRRAWAKELCDMAQRLEDPFWVQQARLALLIDAIAAGEGDEADRHVVALAAATDELGTPRARWVLALTSASWHRLRGDFAVADEMAMEAAELGHRQLIPDTQAALAVHLFLSTFHRGSLAPLRAAIEQFVAERPEMPAWRLGAGLAAAAEGDHGAARRTLHDVVDLLPHAATDETWLLVLCFASELAHLLADHQVAELLRPSLDAHAGEFVVFGAVAGEFGPVDRCRGLAAAGLGDLDGAVSCFASAASACRRLGAQAWLLRTRVDHAVCARRLGAEPEPWWDDAVRDVRSAGLDGTLHSIGAAV